MYSTVVQLMVTMWLALVVVIAGALVFGCADDGVPGGRKIGGHPPNAFGYPPNGPDYGNPPTTGADDGQDPVEVIVATADMSSPEDMASSGADAASPTDGGAPPADLSNTPDLANPGHGGTPPGLDGGLPPGHGGPLPPTSKAPQLCHQKNKSNARWCR